MRKGKIGLMALLLVAVVAAGAAAFGPPCWMDDMETQGGGMGMKGGGMEMGCNMGIGGCMGTMGCGRGMMGSGMGLMGPVGPYGMLDLTSDQNTKINKVLDNLRKKHLTVMGKMLDEQAKMRDLFDEEKLDVKKIGAVQDAISALRRQVLESRVDATNRVREILTKEQRDELKELMRGRGYGMRNCRGSGMGSGMGGGQMRRGMMGQ